MSEVNIQVQETVENVDIVAQNNVIEVNITRQSGGGGGAVDSVNGQTGVVVLDATDVGAYTTGQVDTLLSGKFNNPTGNNAQYLDGAGVPTTFPSLTGFVPYTGANQDVDLGEYSFKAGQFELDQSPTGTAGVAITRWNDAIGSTETTLKGGNVVLKNGVDLVARVVNKVTPNTTLTKANYPAVRISGAQGQRLAVAYAQANNDNNSADTIGLVCETIATNQEGFIITVGQLEGINTTGSLQGETWADGDVLYLSPTTAGRLTNVKPSAPSHIVVIGYVEYAHAVNGKIYVKIMNGWELDELHNVAITSPANNQVLAYNSSTQLWENESIGSALGYTPVQTESWVNYSSLSTILGFSTLNTVVIRYLKIGKSFLYYYNISGVSNSGTFTFTIHTNHLGSGYFTSSGLSINNGVNQNTANRIGLSTNSDIIDIRATLNGGSFGTTATKASSGWFIVESN